MIHLHFPTPIFIVDELLTEEAHTSLKKKCDAIKGDITKTGFDIGWYCNVKTSFGNLDYKPHKDEDFINLVEHITGQAENFLKEIESPYKNVIPTNCWINVSNRGDYQEQHTHPNSSLSCVYYVKAPQGSGNTVFLNPYTKHSTFMGENCPVTKQTTTYAAEERKLILFESHVPHMVTPHESDEERLTISVNFTVEEGIEIDG